MEFDGTAELQLTFALCLSEIATIGDSHQVEGFAFPNGVTAGKKWDEAQG